MIENTGDDASKRPALSVLAVFKQPSGPMASVVAKFTSPASWNARRTVLPKKRACAVGFVGVIEGNSALSVLYAVHVPALEGVTAAPLVFKQRGAT